MATLHHYVLTIPKFAPNIIRFSHHYNAAGRQVTNDTQVGAFLTIARNSDDVHELSLVRIVVYPGLDYGNSERKGKHEESKTEV